MAGYWLRPDTGECVQVATTHDEWLQNQKNAEDLGLLPEACKEIMGYAPTAVDEIRLVGVRHGLVRIREHKRHVSVQFWAELNCLNSVLQAVVKALNGVGIHPDTRLVIDNLLSDERVAMTLRELEAALENGEMVLGSRADDQG